MAHRRASAASLHRSGPGAVELSRLLRPAVAGPARPPASRSILPVAVGVCPSLSAEVRGAWTKGRSRSVTVEKLTETSVDIAGQNPSWGRSHERRLR